MKPRAWWLIVTILCLLWVANFVSITTVPWGQIGPSRIIFQSLLFLTLPLYLTSRQLNGKL